MTDHQRMPYDTVDLLRQANEVVLDLLANVTPEQLPGPTVNDEWDVRTLINHLVLGNQWSTEMLAGGNPPRPSGDAIGDRSPREAFAETADALMAALAEPGALERIVRMPFGEMPGAGVAGFRFMDTIGHAWDLAQATGQSTDIAPELSEIAFAMTRQRLDRMDRAQTPFKEEVPVPADAPAADRLAGYLGKRV
jgi:uncharacterized protein (TIGR03086 family)